MGELRIDIIFYTTPLPESRGFLFMKKFIALFLSILMCVSFAACGKSPESTSAEGAQTANSGETYSNVAEKSESVTEKNSGESSEKNSETPSKASPAENGSTETEKAHSVSQSAVSSAVQTTSSTSNPDSKITCTVQVECKKILAKKNKFKKDIALIEPDGVILAPVKVYLDDGATAYDALKKACDENGIALNVQNSTWGVYVVGIGGIEEKDCGPQSGWLYFVNGKSPSTGLSNYKIKSGDSLTLSYTC